MDTASNPLLGSWQLRRWEITYSDGRAPTLPYGDAAVGLIVYAADGFMSASIARAGRPALSSESVRSAPEAERLAAFESYFHYAGPYVLTRDAALPTGLRVAHHVTMALNPNFVGSVQHRDVAFAADGMLTLSASDRLPGTEETRESPWRVCQGL